MPKIFYNLLHQSEYIDSMLITLSFPLKPSYAPSVTLLLVPSPAASLRQMSSSALRKVERRHDRERRLVLLLVAIIVAFFVTNIPSAILSVTYSDRNKNRLGFQVFRAVANNLEFLNFGLSFVLYFLFSRDIRGAFVSILKRAARPVTKTLSGGHSSSSKQYDK